MSRFLNNSIELFEFESLFRVKDFYTFQRPYNHLQLRFDVCIFHGQVCLVRVDVLHVVTRSLQQELFRQPRVSFFDEVKRRLDAELPPRLGASDRIISACTKQHQVVSLLILLHNVHYRSFYYNYLPVMAPDFNTTNRRHNWRYNWYWYTCTS